MTVSVSEIKKKLKITSEREAKINARAHQLIQEELTLRELRRAQSMTQERLAELLGIEQDSISRLERRADMLLSTMSSYVEAMGGTLKLVAEFPDREPYAVRLAALSPSSGSPQPPRPRRGPKKIKSGV